MPKNNTKPDASQELAEEQKPGFFAGFLDFVREQGVVGFAIGFILGAASTTLVKSLVDNVIMPPVGILLGSAGGLANLKIYLGTYQHQAAYLQYGKFLNDLINFLILAFVVYIVAKLLRLDRLDKKKA
jgi:large conductance mechanosensitive channel